MVYKQEQVINRKMSDSILETDRIILQVGPEPFVDDFGDYLYPELLELNMSLLDESHVGYSKDYIVEKQSWVIRGILLELDQEFVSEIGDTRTIIPIQNAEFSTSLDKVEIKINALYVLDDDFLLAKKQV